MYQPTATGKRCTLVLCTGLGLAFTTFRELELKTVHELCLFTAELKTVHELCFFTAAPRLSKKMLVILLLLLSSCRPKSCPWLQLLLVRYMYKVTEPWLWIVALFDYWVVCTYSWPDSDFVFCKNSHSPNCSQAWYSFSRSHTGLALHLLS